MSTATLEIAPRIDDPWFMSAFRSLLILLCLIVACDCGDDGGGDDGGTEDAPGTDTNVDAPGVDAPGVDAPGVDAPGVDAPGTDTGMCAPVGNACAAAGDCCSGTCNSPAGTACAGEADCICAPRADCFAAGTECTADEQCCNRLCDRPDGAAMGTCAEIGGCMPAGEPCSSPGLSGACCSTICLQTSGEGPTCQFLGGCRVQDELCSSDGQCCSGVCEERGMTLDGRSIMRCANADSCLPAGEVCGEGGASSNCCPNGGGDTGCEPSGAGFRRCLGGTGDCVLPGRECESTEDCCVDTYPDIMCSPGPTGEDLCCLPEGAECAFGDVCCGGICTPDDEGVLRCGDGECLMDGAACTTASDCCGCGCLPDGTGALTCTSDPDECGPCTGPNLGEVCDPDGEACCNGPTVICSGGEFPLCVLAP